MIVLALDTATPETLVVLDCPGEPLLHRRHTPGPGERPGHGRCALTFAEELLAEAGLTPSAVGRVAVGVGPGSFTGLRIGVAAARGLAQATGAELAAVPTPEVLAAAAADGARSVLACLDARRGEAFTAITDPAGELVAAAAATRPEDLAALVAAHAPVVAVGDGAVRFRSELERAGADVPPDDSELHRLDPAALARVARGVPAAERDTVVPEYVRAPDAVPRPR